MRTLVLALQLLIAVLFAVIRGAVQRLLHGPAVETWSWSLEMRVVALRGVIMGARAHPDPEARTKLEAKVNPPLPRDLRHLVHVRPEMLAGLDAERHVRTGSGSELRDTCTILYLHGGGYVSGSAATHRRWVARLTWAVAGQAIVPNYRLAPRHRFPAAVDDAVAAYAKLTTDVDPAAVVLAGDSAGGGLAAALLLRLRDEGTPLPAGAMLFSPYTDLEHTGTSIFRNVATDYLPIGEVRPNWEYLGDHDPRDPLASPMYGDFTGIPPLLVFAGGREMILDDSVRLAEAAARDGVDVSLEVSPDMFHVWPALAPHHPATGVLLAQCAEFVNRVTGS